MNELLIFVVMYFVGVYVSFKILKGDIEVDVPRYKNPPPPPTKKMWVRYEYTEGITPNCDGYKK